MRIVNINMDSFTGLPKFSAQLKIFEKTYNGSTPPLPLWAAKSSLSNPQREHFLSLIAFDLGREEAKMEEAAVTWKRFSDILIQARSESDGFLIYLLIYTREWRTFENI